MVITESDLRRHGQRVRGQRRRLFEVPLSSRNILAITENDKVFQANRLLSTDQYFFQPSRSFLFTLKAHT